MSELQGSFERSAYVTWANTIDPEPVTWAWQEGTEGRIPAGSLVIAAGREGTGKSSFGIWMAGQITKGLLPGSFFGTPRSVLYLAVEDSWRHTLVPRLMAAGADLSKVGRLDVVSEDGDELTLSLPTDLALLEAQIQRHGIALVVLDPLMSLIGEKIDTHREREVRSALDPLAKLADRTGAVVLGIAHFNKGGGTDAASLITGSGAFKNVPRSVFGFARDESDEARGRVMSQVKNSLGRDDLPSLTYTIETATVDTKFGPAETGRFSFTGTSDRSVADVLRDSRGSADDLEEAQDIATWLTEYLESVGGSAPANDVKVALRGSGYSWRSAQRASRKVATKRRDGFGQGSQVIWELSHTRHIDAIGVTNQNLAPMAPMAASMAIDPDEGTCTVCSEPLHASTISEGFTTHPGCEVAA